MTTKINVNFSNFEKATGISFQDKDLLKKSFIHRSYINENSGVGLEHNERLEFLGDAVLELVVTDYLFKKFPNRTEGEMTSFRSALVNSVTLSEVANEVGMGNYLLLSKGEAKDKGKARQYILANTFEAYVGALYLDQGYDKAGEFIKKFLLPRTDEIVQNGTWRDAKSLVQEKAQEYIGVTPSYRVISETGPDHDKYFTIGIVFGDELIAEGKGKSKQEAEQNAAMSALKIKKWME